MKHFFISLLLLGVSMGLFAQSFDDEDNLFYPRNEIKLNLPLTIFGSYPEISYERILQEDISVGASLGAGFDEDRFPMKYAFIPYFRWFFGGNRKSMQKAGAGFFIEVNGGLFSSQTEQSYIPGNSIDKFEFGAGLGLGVGWKYVTKNNWVGEIYTGGGRNLLKDNGGYPHWGISIGKRF